MARLRRSHAQAQALGATLAAFLTGAGLAVLGLVAEHYQQPGMCTFLMCCAACAIWNRY